METAYVTSKGQLVIPARLRRRYGIKPGTKVCFVERDHEILFQPVTKEYIRSVCGMLKSDTSVTQELLKERARDKEREEAKLEKFRSR
ncbi:MAG TPA: AbrB/MazE/SpoVT family DNA-binding domain-containing protein [Thermodesulfobacteriota bacterium]|jgi:AbrB family looped-hinge helix DNA binding protein|nr:AbrB/MazE/SpoVT family DNA-binding domain-containing protein [Thermodesulfobacteriota bacterium]